jgi:hypothetical protein
VTIITLPKYANLPPAPGAGDRVREHMMDEINLRPLADPAEHGARPRDRDITFAPFSSSEFEEAFDVARQFASPRLGQAVKVCYEPNARGEFVYRVHLLQKERPVNSGHAANNAISPHQASYRSDSFLAETADAMLTLSEVNFANHTGKVLHEGLAGAHIFEVGPYGSGEQTRILAARFPKAERIHVAELDGAMFLSYLRDFTHFPEDLRRKVTVECGDMAAVIPPQEGFGAVFINNVLVREFDSYPALCCRWRALAAAVKKGAVIMGSNDYTANDELLCVAAQTLGCDLTSAEDGLIRAHTVLVRTRLPKSHVDMGLPLKEVA